jgi:hypothetical protein
LTEVFGDFRWQIATTATDANRFALRVARAVTGKAKVLVFNGCYHGTVDDAFVTLKGGKTVNRPGLLGQVADLTKLAVCCEFNDLAGVEKALAKGDVAAILIAGLAQSFPEWPDEIGFKSLSGISHESHAGHRCALLRTRCERPNNRGPAEKRDELPPPHSTLSSTTTLSTLSDDFAQRFLANAALR